MYSLSIQGSSTYIKKVKRQSLVGLIASFILGLFIVLDGHVSSFGYMLLILFFAYNAVALYNILLLSALGVQSNRFRLATDINIQDGKVKLPVAFFLGYGVINAKRADFVTITDSVEYVYVTFVYTKPFKHENTLVIEKRTEETLDQLRTDFKNYAVYTTIT